MVRTYVEQVYGWVRTLIGVTSTCEVGADSHEGLLQPLQWQPFEPVAQDEPTV